MATLNELISQETIGSMHQGIITLQQFLEKMLYIFKDQQEINNSTKLGIEALLKEVKRNGNIKVDEIAQEYSALYKNMLENFNIPYFATTNAKEDGSVYTSFFTRESDALILGHIRNDFKKSIAYGIGKLDPKTFNLKYKDEPQKEIGPLDTVELDKFCFEAEGFDYCIKMLTTDQYSIVYPKKDENNLIRAMRTVAFAFSGEEGATAKERYKKALEERNAFLEDVLNQAKNKDIVIVDTLNPNSFVSLGKSELDDWGSMVCTKHIISSNKNDKSIKIKDFSRTYDISELEAIVGDMYEPVVMPRSELKVIKDIDKDTKIATISGNYWKDLESIKLSIQSKTKYKASHDINMINMPAMKPIRVYHINEDMEEEIKSLIEKHNLKETKVGAGVVVFTTNDQEFIDDFIIDKANKVNKANKAYENAAFIRFRARLEFENRGIINLEDKNEQYIVDATSSEFRLKLSNDGIELYDREGVVLKEGIDNPNFSDDVNNLLMAFNEPYAIDKDIVENAAQSNDYSKIAQIIDEKRSLTEEQSKIRTDLVKVIIDDKIEELRQFKDNDKVIETMPTFRQIEAKEALKRFKTIDRQDLENGLEQPFEEEISFNNHMI